MSDSGLIEPVDAAFAVLEELKRQRTEGIRELYMEDSTLESLEDLLGGSKMSTPVLQRQEVASVAGPVPDVFTSVVKEPISTAPLPKASEPKPSLQAVNPALLTPAEITLPQGTKQEQWGWLKERVLGCETCKSELNPNGKIVFGVGNFDADLFLCGEAPGAEEETAGEPFVGPAGELLDRIISAMGLSRESVYIGNVVNFRPRHERAYGNRPPTADEMNFCLPYLRAQLEIVKPKVIVALGKTATDGLLGADPQRRLGQMRGNWHQYEGTPLMVTYHPSYLLHNPSKSSKRKVWEDMLLVMDKLELPISEKQRGFFQ